MGNDESLTKWKHLITISLPKNSFFDKETIYGEVKLTLDKPLTFTDIVVSLQLNEVWHFQQGKHHYSNSNQNTIVSVKLNIPQMLGISDPTVNLVAGNYSYAFSISLPKNIQPSYLLQTYINSFYSTYSILAEILNPFEPMILRHLIVIKSNPPESNLLYLSQTANVCKWGLSDKGQTTISAKIPYSNYKYGNNVPFEVTLDNSKGKLIVKECRIQIIRHAHFKNKSGQICFPCQYVYYKFDHPFVCKVGQTVTQWFTIPIHIDKYKSTMEVIKPYPNPINPTEFWPTMTSLIFHSFYFIKATAYFESVVFKKSRPRVLLPIIICHQTKREPNTYTNSDNTSIPTPLEGKRIEVNYEPINDLYKKPSSENGDGIKESNTEFTNISFDQSNINYYSAVPAQYNDSIIDINNMKKSK